MPLMPGLLGLLGRLLRRTSVGVSREGGSWENEVRRATSGAFESSPVDLPWTLASKPPKPLILARLLLGSGSRLLGSCVLGEKAAGSRTVGSSSCEMMVSKHKTDTGSHSGTLSAPYQLNNQITSPALGHAAICVSGFLSTGVAGDV
eukprot:1158310-Pelagomonas_calceolata.AAC.17